MTEVIKIGIQENSKITAFGDDCKYHDINAYAYIIVENDKLELARSQVSIIKNKYGIPQNIPLHMREINSAKYRSENGISHLKKEDIHDLIAELIMKMNTVPVLLQSSYYSGSLPKDIVSITDEGNFSIRWSDKGIQSLLAKDALLRLNLLRYSLSDLNIVISNDPTKIEFLGEGRRQAARWANGFSDANAPNNLIFDIEPHIDDPKNEVMLQMADIGVYIISHAFHVDDKMKAYKNLLEKFNNYSVYHFV